MKNGRKKFLIILDELMRLFLKFGCSNITVNFDIENNLGLIHLRGKYAPEAREHIKSLEESLNCGRNVEMEECYWAISGSGGINQGSELYVVGSMLDRCTVQYDDEYVEVFAYRKQD